MDDEQRQRKLLAEQIARAQTEASSSSAGGPTVEEGIQRDPETKLSFSFGAPKPVSPPADPSNAEAGPSSASSSSAVAAAASSAASAVPATGVKIGFNPLKRPASSSNVFKTAKKASSSSSSSAAGPSSSAGGGAKLSAAAQLMKEDEERKKRMAENRGSGGFVGGKRVRL